MTPLKSDHHRALAIAAIAQQALMVKQLAHHGLAPLDKLNTALFGLLNQNPTDVRTVFGSVSALKTGLYTLEEQLTGKLHLADDDVKRYVISILYLERLLASQPKMLSFISSQLKNLKDIHAAKLNGDNQSLIRALAQLYQDTISTLGFRIQVRGDILRLKNDFLAARLRLLLFAGIRGAVLWHQCGGRRWHLLFRRARLLQATQELLQTPHSNS